MNTTNELVYVEVDIYRPGETELTDALLDWSDHLWVFPERSDLSDIMDATEETVGDDSTFKTLAFHFTVKPLPNPGYMPTQYQSVIEALIEEALAGYVEPFEVEANEQWAPLLQRKMAELPSANQIGFYAVYAVAETTCKDENGANTSIEFEYVGELDFARLPLVQS